MQNFERFLCATRLVRLSPTNRSKPKNAKIMLFQAGSDTPPLLKQGIKSTAIKMQKPFIAVLNFFNYLARAFKLEPGFETHFFRYTLFKYS